MMTTGGSRKRIYIPVGLITILILLFSTTWLARLDVKNARADKVVQDSWKLMQQAGSYEFSTTVEQTTYPAPKLTNVGRSSTKDVYHVSGKADLPSQTLLVSLWKNQGNLLSSQDGIEIRIEGSKAWGRSIGADWKELDYSASAFAPGNDASSYLTAAKNVRYQDSVAISLPGSAGVVTRVTAAHYSFDLDPDRLASYVRDQMMLELQRAGKLPLGMNLSVSDQVRSLVANGEVWVNSDGLPLRMKLNMKFPQEKNGERVEAVIATDFFNHATQNLIANRPLPVRLAGMLGLPTTLDGLKQFTITLELAASVVLLILLTAVYANKHYVYMTIAILVIFSMLFTPLWQGAKAASFTKEAQAKQAKYETDKEKAANEQKAVQEAFLSEWDPFLSPFERAGLKIPAQPPTAANTSYKPLAFLNLPSLLPKSLNQAAEETTPVDTDGDGLTDDYEKQFWPSGCPTTSDPVEIMNCVLNPLNADTDGDGLSDNEELKLDVMPNVKDSDGDGIPDQYEVQSFFYSDKDWYSNPNMKDTDHDGILDGAECPERVITPDQPVAGVCRDTDQDGRPDIFDTDDDNDGVPTVVDVSPYAYSSSPQVFTKDHPFVLYIENLATANMVYVTYQLRPTNPEHLTYAQNVLDWPADDTDGQIQRVMTSTFGTNLSSGALEADPRATYGDMRLIPMLEIRVKSDDVPLPLTNTITVPISDTLFVGSFLLTTGAESHYTEVKLVQGPVGTYPVYYADGRCNSFKLSSKIGDLSVGGSGIEVGVSLGSFANGSHPLVIMNSDGTQVTACADVTPVAHGSLRDWVVDSTILQAYGASARNDVNNDVLIYSPLSLMNDYTGGSPVAFGTTVPFFGSVVGGVGTTTLQEVRAVWMLNMLTDQCNMKDRPADYDESTDGPWCAADKPERWIKNVPQIIQIYPEDYTLSGVSVKEDRGVDMAVVFEDPNTDPDPQYDDPLWALSHGLDGSFAAGRDSNSDHLRDITVATIEQRFDPDLNGCPNGSGDPYYYRTIVDDWGLACNAFQVVRFQYPFADGIKDFISKQVKEDIFGSYFNVLPEGSRPHVANLLFARETNARSVDLGESAATCLDNRCELDFSDQQVRTTVILNWAPYQRDGDNWSSYPLKDYLDLLEANLRQLDAYRPENDTYDAKAIVDGNILMTRLYYESIYRGAAMLVALNGEPVVNDPQVLDDSDIRSDFSSLNAKAQIVTKVVRALTEIFVLTLFKYPLLYGLLVTPLLGKLDKIQVFFMTLYQGVVDKVTDLGKMISSTLTRVALGVAIGVVVAGLAVCAVLMLLDANSLAGRIGGGILFGAIGLLSAALAIKAIYDVYKLYQGIKAGLDAATASLKASVIGAVVAAVVGVIITWGVFFASWGMSGAKVWSLELHNMVADAVAATVNIVIFTVLACAFPVGTIIAAIIGLIDGLIAIACAIANAVTPMPEDHWAKEYICIGISGWVTKVIKWVIYSQTYLVDYENGDRLNFTGLAQELSDLPLGIAVGNTISYTVNVSNTITLSDIPVDWKAALFWWQYSGDNAKTANFTYKIQDTETALDEDLERGSMSSKWVSVGEDQWAYEFNAQTDGYSIPMPSAGINRDPEVYVSEGAAIPAQECTAWPLPIPIIPFWILIPECHLMTFKNSIHMPISSTLTVDVMPATLDDFYTLQEMGDGGYSFSWGRDASLTFPTFKDADGDTLISAAYGGNDPNDSLYDTDNDGLSDTFEIQMGTNPRLIDTDDDGLRDDKEIQVGTDPTRKDSDGDGLPDNEEIDGWLFTYGFEADGTPKETMVYPDPQSPDTDFDGITDLQEKIYGFNPNSPDKANLLEYTMSSRELDSPLVMLRFDEGAASTMFADSSNFNYRAACSGDTCPLSGLDGRYSKAIRLDGSDYLNLPASAGSLSFIGNQPFTLGTWVYWEGNSGTMLSKWSEAPDFTQEMRFGINNAGNLQLIGSSTTATSSDAISPQVWTHIAAAYDGSQATFYIDGAPSGSAAWVSNSSAITPTQVMVGGYIGAANPQGFYNGMLDELAIFDRALTQEEIHDYLMAARYNFNDTFVRPGEQISYKSVVENLLNSRFAYGLLTTVFHQKEAIVDWATKLLPKTFVLWPDNPVVTGVNTAVISDTLQIEPTITESQPFTITQTASAEIVDRRSESNLAELWLKLNEVVGVSQFEDSSGNMPPRNASCSPCPTSGEAGILNNAVKFSMGGDRPVQLPTLETMRLLNRGYTVALWVKPSSTASSPVSMTLLGSPGDRFTLKIKKDAGGNYVPQVFVNGSDVTTGLSLWRTLLPNVWSHLAVQYSSADQKLNIFVNGARVKTISGVSSITTTADLSLGGAPQDVDYWVDDLRIFSRPLSTGDINRMAERPVLYLTMDSSNFADASVYGQSVLYGASINAHVWTPQRPAGSIRGNSMSPGSGLSLGYLKVNGNALLDMQDGAFTFSAWIYPNNGATTSDWQGVWGYSSSDSTAYPTLERRGRQLRFGYGDGSAWVVKESGDVLTLNDWNHVVVTLQRQEKSGGGYEYEYQLYIDAQAVDSYIFSNPPSSASSTSFFVGHSSYRYNSYVSTMHVVDKDSDPGDVAEAWIKRYIDGSFSNCIFYNAACDTFPVSGVKDYGVYYGMNYYNYENIRYDTWEDDLGSCCDDFCGSAYNYWYDPSNTTGWPITNGFNGTLYVQFTRPSIQFYGNIDELEVYRYAMDSEQVFDLYNAIPITARLPLDDRPASDTFENRAFVGTLDDGVCSGTACPAAGTVGLIDQAVRFDGVNDVISVPVDTTSDYMVSLWVNTACPSCGMYTLNDSSDSTLNQIYLENGDVCAKTGSTEMCSRGGNVSDERWHHVVYANNGSTANLWLDGEVVNSIVGGATLSASPLGHALLGVAPNAAQTHLDGQLDDVRVFRYSQSAGVVALLKRRAPLALFHLEEPTAAGGMQDSTPKGWWLDCISSSNPDDDQCPKADMQGRLGRAVEFDGVNDMLMSREAKLSDTAKDFSLSLWVMPNRVVNVPQTLWSMGFSQESMSSYPKYTIATAPDSLKLCVLNASQDNTACTGQSNVDLIKNVWNFVTLTIERTPDDEHYSLYINGYLDSTGSGLPHSWINDGLGKIAIGDIPSQYVGYAGGSFGGKIDEVTVFDYMLNEIDVRDTFYYQMASVEERASMALTIDAESPQVDLASFNLAFPYLDGNDHEMQVDATDSTSGIAMVEMQVQHQNAPSPVWQVAPLCLDSTSKTSFCPMFIPSFGDGIYMLTFRAVDKVGHQSVTTPYQIFVDDASPRITIDQADGSLQAAEKHPSLKHTWILKLSGGVGDVLLSNGSPGSGLNLDTVRVTVYSHSGEVVGSGTQVPTLTPAVDGYDWNIDYLLPELEPTGKLRVVVEAQDKVGNLGTKEINIRLDATPAEVKVHKNLLPHPTLSKLAFSPQDTQPILTNGTISGDVSDIPGDLAPYITPDGKDAASGVSGVDVAFTPSVDVSYLFNEPYPDGLLAWLPLDSDKNPTDANGNPDPNATTRLFVDISPYQVAGVCEVDDCPRPGIAGHKQGSIYYDGSGQYINLGQQVDLANRSFTVSIWARPDQTGRNDPMLWQGPVSVANERFLFGLNSEDRFVCGFGGSDLLTDVYPDDDWHYWACSYDHATGTRTIYRDGAAVASDVAAPMPKMYENLYIGLAPVGSYLGHLDELVVFDRPLDADEIRQQYTGYNMVFHMAVEGDFYANGDILPDRSGYFHTAELQSGSGDALNKVVAGRVGPYALTFDGNDRLAVLPAYSLNLDRAAFTLSAWISPTVGTGEQDIISQRDENPEQRYPSLILTADNHLKVGFGNGYNWFSVETLEPVITPNAWNFVTTTFDGVTCRIYVNGQLKLETTDLAGLVPYGAERFNIGDQFTGQIDDVRLFVRALNELEIKALWGTSWLEANLAGSGNTTSWTADLVSGLEGSYKIDVRGWDHQGHFSVNQPLTTTWDGLVDTLAPRITLSRNPTIVYSDTTVVTYTFSIEDTMLNEASIMQNMCNPVTITSREYYNSSHYLALGIPPNTALYRLTGECQADPHLSPFAVGLTACDLGGNCTSQTFPPLVDKILLLPLIFQGGAVSALEAPERPPVPTQKPATPLPQAQPLSQSLAFSGTDRTPPDLMILSDRIGQADIRSLIHINLKGTVSDPAGIAWVQVNIRRAGEVIYTVRAAVYGDLWNAMWVFMPGQAPASGTYTLEATAVDWAGNQVTVVKDITVQLAP